MSEDIGPTAQIVDRLRELVQDQHELAALDAVLGNGATGGTLPLLTALLSAWEEKLSREKRDLVLRGGAIYSVYEARRVEDKARADVLKLLEGE